MYFSRTSIHFTSHLEGGNKEDEDEREPKTPHKWTETGTRDINNTHDMSVILSFFSLLW